ncbi:MAG: type I-E CRISPR-associated protein Cse1/CasA [Hydrogenophaga sp.]|uniref:type I-E CRISPR-associated protein Cse1/CasA n=1 Tax=Hydrogenophaga sp. TaxID=1904254 RepID=UPI002716BBB4|nr:type I-E CRISPR-associated protein Cse1/CasA [Hydrogenophaga sp.]MDO9483722.1 type I-E CRISPR-associated protein Cse1/CasA [Hydrogenophaga sp.]MDP3344411.1 type I-E CRISPR-associated protein Cse1/CasA [Hydrogenophaga sp.]MDP3809174.1 type I-E CRISPR-associated protein Cse1/CasA [Hydrogenophaga sp.]MDP3925744.1 type I-E CRISPR-associated protein Cse1/CasA [Hydrogenophaga sp.]
MTPQHSAPDPTQTLFGNLLDERLLHYRRTGTGERVATTLPELFLAMAQDQVRDFPALRPHQRHPWHAFLVQLAAIALHRAGRTEPFVTPGEWRAGLVALTPNDQDGAAWCLVSPVERPAFLQAPVLAGLDSKWETRTAADEIDVIKASKNHDLKSQRMTRTTHEDWIFALISLQTQSPGDSGSYKESSRMDGGWGRRPGIGIVPPGGYGCRWLRDQRILLSERSKISETFGLDQKGVAVTWLLPWDGSAHDALMVSDLDPFYIEVSRRIRFVYESGAIKAKTATTPISRIKPIKGGLTGDIWSPIDSDKDGRKILTVRPSGFNYKRAVNLLVPGVLELAPAMKIQRSDPPVGLTLNMQSIAWGPKNTNAGYHAREVRIGKKLAVMLSSMKQLEIDRLAEISKSRVEQIHEVSWMLEQALAVLFTNGAQSESSKRNDSTKERAKRFAEPFEAQCDAQFFPELINEIEADNREAVREKWLLALAERAERVLQSAFDAGPRSGQLRYRAQSEALRRLHSTMRSDKSKLPALAQALKSKKSTPFTSTDEETHEHA